MSDFTYSRTAHQYRDAASGRFISQATVREARDTFLASRQAAMRAVTAPLANGGSLQGWVRAMRDQIKTSHLASYILGRGGRANMTPADWGRVGRNLRTEYGYLQRFAGEVAIGRLSPAQAEARAAMYGASVTPYQQGRMADYGWTPPVMPGQGTACRSNCRCEWEIEETENALEATWVVTADAESCEDCLSRADTYSPLVVRTFGGVPV